jgi:hypothetical protein
MMSAKSKMSVRGENSAPLQLPLSTVEFSAEEQAERLSSVDSSFNLSIEWEGDPNAADVRTILSAAGFANLQETRLSDPAGEILLFMADC